MFNRVPLVSSGLLGVVVAAGTVGFAPPAAAQAPCTTYPPSSPSDSQAPGMAVAVRSIEPLRWTWEHWWESNRWRYLDPVRQAASDQSAADGVLAERRATVLGVLERAIAADHVGTRRAAATAYGRLRAPDGVRPLAARLGAEPDMLVRMLMATSLGAIGTPEAQRLMLAADYPDDATFAGAVIGLGLAERLSDDSEAGLRGLTGRRGIVGDAAIWALGQHAVGGDVSFDVVRRSASVWEASEAVIDLGRTDDPAAGRLLAQLATAGVRDRSPSSAMDFIAGLEQSVAQMAARAEPSEETGIPISSGGNALRAIAGLDLHRPDLRPLVEGWRGWERPLGRIGYGPMLRSRIRAAAALGMAQREDDVTARALVAMARGNERDELQHLPIGMALVAIGERGIEPGLARTAAIVDAPDARRNRRQELLDSPLRGFGAIALGLYARPVETLQGQQDRPGWEGCVDILVQRAADETERVEVRRAAVVALGLTRRTEVLRGFVAINRSLTDDDRALAGDVVMARAMLGDRSAPRDAASLLATATHRDAAADTSARRGAVLAIGLSGQREMLDVLVGAWDADWFVSREVQRSLDMLGGVGVVDALMDELKRQSDPDVQAYIIDTLGRLLAHDRRGVDGLGEGRMFAMRNDLFGQYRSLAEPYLYGVLVPQIEDEADDRWR